MFSSVLSNIFAPTELARLHRKILQGAGQFRGGSRIFIGEGLQVIGGALLAIEGAPLPLTATMHFNENYEMLVSL